MSPARLAKPETPLQIRLFGTFHLRCHGVDAPAPRSRAAHWLLAWLILRRKTPLERGWLAQTLWPGNCRENALFNLRRNLTEARKILGPEAHRLQSPTPQTLWFDTTDCDCDLLTFETSLLRGDIPSLEQAVAVYTGDLLEGCREDWILPERSRCEQQYLAALEQLAAHEYARSEWEKAAHWLRLLTTREPERESAQQQLMEILAKQGDFAAVTEVYHRLRRILRETLNTSPSEPTVALYERLKQQAFAPSVTMPPVQESQPPVPESRPSRSGDSVTSKPRLPRPLTSLVGRKATIGEISALLRSERLVTLTGTGGIGKTRLAIAVGDAASECWTDGVFWGDLASLAEPMHLAPALLRVFGLEDSKSIAPLDALAGFLRERHLLLILDNCEHLALACAELCSRLLGACERLHILATSRQPLNIAGETVWRVPALTVPTLCSIGASVDAESLCASEAVQLFTARAQSAQRDFRITSENSEAVARICRTLDGIPLALELAAVWVRSLSVEQIAARLGESFTLLARGNRSAPPRHQTLQTLIEWSEALLEPKERDFLAQLAVFSGGWTLQAAEAVCLCETAGGEEIALLLNRLVEQSLVEAEGSAGEMRYRLLETVRQFAAVRLKARADAARLRERHRHYYLFLAETLCSRLGKADSASLLDRLEPERDNFRAALASCRADKDPSDLELRLATFLHHFFVIRGTLDEGIQALTAGLERCAAGPVARAEGLLALGYLRTRNSEYTAALAPIEEALAIFRQHALPHREAETLWKLGFPFFQLDQYDRARAYLHEALTLSRRIGAKYQEARAIALLGMIAKNEGDTQNAVALFARAVFILEELGECEANGIVLHNWGNALREQGDWRQARRFYERSLAIHRQLGKRNWMGYNLDELARCCLKEGDIEQARLLTTEMLALMENDPYQTAIYSHLLANIALRENRLEEARQRLLQATVWEQGALRNLSYCFWTAAEIARAEQERKQAARFLAITMRQREAIHAPFAVGERQELEERIARLRSELGAVAFDTEWEAGKKLDSEDALLALRAFCTYRHSP